MKRVTESRCCMCFSLNERCIRTMPPYQTCNIKRSPSHEIVPRTVPLLQSFMITYYTHSWYVCEGSMPDLARKFTCKNNIVDTVRKCMFFVLPLNTKKAPKGNQFSFYLEVVVSFKLDICNKL